MRNAAKQQDTDAVLVDFSKALDNVPFRRLSPGMLGQTLDLIEIFLKMISFQSSENIQKKENGPGRWVSAGSVRVKIFNFH